MGMGSNAVSPKEGQDRKASPALGRKLQAPEDIEGGAKRRCTDLLFMIALIMAWVAMTGLGIDAILTGRPNMLLNGIDYDGRICGVDEDVKEKSKLYYIRIDGTGVCVENCPNATDWSHLWGCMDIDMTYTAANGFDCDTSPSQCLTKSNLNGTGDGAVFRDNGLGTCMYQIESVDFVGRCVYSDSKVLAQFVDVGGDVSYLQEAASDIYTGRLYVFGFGFLFSILLGFLYLGLLRIPGAVCFMVWGSIGCVLLIFLAMGYGLLRLADEWEGDGEHSDVQIMGSKATGCVSYGCAALFVCLILFLRKQIALANGIVKESVSAISRVKVAILMPAFQCVAIVVFMVPWVIYVVFTASLGEISTTTVGSLPVKTFEYSDEVEKRGWYLLFIFFWTTQFIVAMGQIVIALTIVKYYFSKDVETVNNGTFYRSLKEGLRYHTGTAAIGSLIIAIVKTIRAVLGYVQKKLQKSGNKAAEAVLCCLSCFFWCLEKCIKFINKNAYIQVAIFSTSFCRSSKNAFWLIARNLARVGAVTVITEFVAFVMKLTIGLGTAGCLYIFLRLFLDDELYSPIGPVMLGGVMAYYVASSFAGLLDMTTLTILQCFIADEEMFEGDDRFARNDLKQWLENHGAASQPARGAALSPRSDKKKKGGKGEEEKVEGGVAVETGT